MFSPGSLGIPAFLLKRFNSNAEFFFNTKKRKKRKKTKKKSYSHNNQVEIGVNFPKNNIDSDIIGDLIMFRQHSIDFNSIIDSFKRFIEIETQKSENNIK